MVRAAAVNVKVRVSGGSGVRMTLGRLAHEEPVYTLRSGENSVPAAEITCVPLVGAFHFHQSVFVPWPVSYCSSIASTFEPRVTTKSPTRDAASAKLSLNGALLVLASAAPAL